MFGAPVDANNVTQQRQVYLQARARLSQFDSYWEQQFRVTWVHTDNETLVNDAWDSEQTGEKLGLYYQSGLNLSRDETGEVTNSLVLGIDHESEDYRQRGAVQFFGDPNRDESMDNTGFVAGVSDAPHVALGAVAVDPLRR